MSPSREDKKRIRSVQSNKFERLSSSILSSDWGSPDQADQPDWDFNGGRHSDAHAYAQRPTRKHSPAPMRNRALAAKLPQKSDKPGGWGPMVVFGILIGIASFGFAFDFASDGKITHVLGLDVPVAQVASSDGSSEMKQSAVPAPQPAVKDLEPAVAVSAPQAPAPLPVAPPAVRPQLPVVEISPPDPVEKLPAVTPPLAAKLEPAELPIPEPEKTAPSVPSLAPLHIEAPAATAPVVEAPKPAGAPASASTAPRVAAQDSPLAPLAPALEPAVVQPTPAPPVVPKAEVQPAQEVAPVPEATPTPVPAPQTTTAPAPKLVQSIQRGNVIRDCADCPQLVAVPAGSFVKIDPAKPGTAPNTITITHDFAIGRYEITFDDWAKCVMDRGCLALPSDGGWGRDRRPLIFVSYEDISTQYLPWLSKLTGHTYRLPTKDEWQFAAADSADTAPGKGQSGALSDCFNASGAAAPECATAFNGTAPVGSFPPNTLGVYDMKGNVWEWSADCWHPFSYAPKTGDTSCDMHLVLGGAWSTARSQIGQQTVGWEKVNKRTNSIGFRIVRSLP